MTRLAGRALRLAPVVAAALLVAGCGSGAEPDKAPARSVTPPLTIAQVTQAETIYAGQACSMCHGEQAEGSENGPALVGLAPRWTVERITSYLEDPEVFRTPEAVEFKDRPAAGYAMEMPAYGHLSADERRLVARWLIAR